MKSRSSAAIWALFLGGVGAHKFYLGHTGIGLLYLLFCWTGIPLIAAIIDCIGLFSMSDDTFNRRYNTYLYDREQRTQPHNLTNNVSVTTSHESDLDRLEKLARLRDSGVISDIEFDRQKATILRP